ncbi:hypothetical protein BS639_16995 [Rouxiella silvae]|uniref:Uncharacterized protein n=1 Tax=Rouxiella silvae TaxID=1646373 RepID=A0ABX3TXQ0_9GAMM|nr:hypothetical protein [Rouxiella silvae]ORJ19991.1 hypothetical protein BS639_16995 [Rouxiella silvae]
MRALPKTLTKPVFITAKRNSYTKEYDLSISEFDSSEYTEDSVLLGIVEVTINVPQPDDILSLEVAKLRSSQAKILAVANHKQALLEDQVQSLLCIDYIPAAPAYDDSNDLPF